MTNNESEQKIEQCQGEIPSEVIDELIAMLLAGRPREEIATRYFELTDQSVDWSTFREAVWERKMTRLKMNGETDLGAVAEGSGRVADMLLYMFHSMVVEYEMLCDAKSWASRQGCLDDFPLEHLEKMEEWSDRIKKFIAVVYPLMCMFKSKRLGQLLSQDRAQV